MNKKLLHITLSLSLLVPLVTYAEDSNVITPPSKNQASQQAISVTRDKDDTKGEQNEATTTASSTAPIKSFTLCSQQAIENRDTKIAASRSIYNAAMTAALTERKNKEKSAVAIADSDDQKAAIKAAVDAYKTMAKNAQNTLVASRKTIWQNFESDIKACHELQDEEISIEKSEKAVKEVSSEPSLMKKQQEDAPETKTIKDSIFNTLRSLFN
jgi:LAS superfamily LD-carboxypeptidase LdcB